MSLRSGINTWAAVAAHSGFTWAWQDIAGLNESESLPEVPPLTSIVWGWSASQVVRVRLDSDIAYVAVRDTTDLTFTDHEPWSDTDKRVGAHVKKVNDGMTDLGLQQFSSAIVRNTNGSPITFIMPTRLRSTSDSTASS